MEENGSVAVGVSLLVFYCWCTAALPYMPMLIDGSVHTAMNMLL